MRRPPTCSPARAAQRRMRWSPCRGRRRRSSMRWGRGRDDYLLIPPRHGEGDRALLQRVVEGACHRRRVRGTPPPPACGWSPSRFRGGMWDSRIMTAFLDALARVPDLLAALLLLAAAAMLLGLAISLPLAIWSARRPTVARVALGFASLVQTIPSLALLALFYPLLLSLSALVGGGIPALGFLPS